MAGILLVLLIIERIWGNHRYDALFKGYKETMQGEITRISQEKRELWERLLGKLPSSNQLPPINTVVKGLEEAGRKSQVRKGEETQ